MSLYQLQKVIYKLHRDASVQARFRTEQDQLLGEFDLTDEERGALRDGDVGLLYVLGVNGQILIHFAAFLGIEGANFHGAMRHGVEMHGPIRDGIYAITGAGKSEPRTETQR